jgi:hypothetical protein
MTPMQAKRHGSSAVTFRDQVTEKDCSHCTPELTLIGASDQELLILAGAVLGAGRYANTAGDRGPVEVRRAAAQQLLGELRRRSGHPGERHAR